jgi:hypothetical protein
MMLSDIYLYSTRNAQHRDVALQIGLFIYPSFVLIVLLGFWLRTRRNVRNIAVATLGGSILFFLVTNFGSWLVFDSYAKTFSELVRCYVMGLPFFRDTLIGDALFVTILFGGFGLLEKFVPMFQEQPALAHAE